MKLTDRIAELEERMERLETKRRELRTQFIALQLVLIPLLPVISAAPAKVLDAAIAAARDTAKEGLIQAGYDAPDIRAVLEAIDTLRADMAAIGGSLAH